MLTGKVLAPDMLSFNKQLLSEYNPEIGLEGYAAYFPMKAKISEITSVSEKINTLSRKDPESPTFDHSAIEKLISTRDKAVTGFFALLQKSFGEVKDRTKQMDLDTLEKLRQLRSYPEEDLRKKPELIEETYTALQATANFRDLNARCFSRILTKFFDRCSRDSLELQRKVRAADKIISESTIAVAPFNLTQQLESVKTIHSIIHGCSFEESTLQLRQSFNREMDHRPRLVPPTSTLHFQMSAAHRNPSTSEFSVRLVRGTANPAVGKAVEKILRIDSMKQQLKKFANGECSIRLDEAVRGADVFVIQSLVANLSKGISLSDTIMELFLSLQCVKLAAANRITAVCPYLAYNRYTASIAAIAELMVLNGCQHVVTIDMQRDQVEGMFPGVPVENITARNELARYLVDLLVLEGHNFHNIVMVSPDSDGVARARRFAETFMSVADQGDEAFVQTCTAVKRIAEGNSQLDVIGNVKDQLCIIVDAVIDEGVNVTEVAKKLKSLGASRIIAVATHAVFSGSAPELIASSAIDEVIATDTTPQEHNLQDPALARKLRIIPIAPLLAEAIQRIHTDNSLSTMFEK